MPVLTLQELLSSFQFLDIAGLYEQNSSTVDFVLAFFLFLGIAQATLGKRFEGRPGNAITVTVALSLLIGFLFTERQMNFSLKSFGPVAALILIFLERVLRQPTSGTHPTF